MRNCGDRPPIARLEKGGAAPWHEFTIAPGGITQARRDGYISVPLVWQDWILSDYGWQRRRCFGHAVLSLRGAACARLERVDYIEQRLARVVLRNKLICTV